MSDVSDIEDLDYYNWGEDDYDMEANGLSNNPEYFLHHSIQIEEVEQFLNESVEELTDTIPIEPSLAKVILRAYKWDKQEIVSKYKENANEVLEYSHVKSGVPVHYATIATSSSACCGVCANNPPVNDYGALACGHQFCNDCWTGHFEVQIMQGVSNTIQCMAQDCEVIAPEDFVLSRVTESNMRDRYQLFMFKDHVKSHPQLRFCPGPNCQWLFRAWPREGARRVQCRGCELITCFSCGLPHHVPTDCATIRRWLTKCADDSETANYISAHTKDCPKCNSCIEKNGGCNHIMCSICKYEFCWICFSVWEDHHCSRYIEENAESTDRHHARTALEKYLHYYVRWENHAVSFRWETNKIAYLKSRMSEKVMAGAGTWIDWQYLWDAATLLKRCRYTLQYTYPYAFYMEAGPKKVLFEYQQELLEKEVEDLSWAVEHAETTDIFKIGNQMVATEKRRTTLLEKFSEF